MPQINRTLDTILKLRKKHEKGELPKDTDAFLTMEQVSKKYGFAYEEHKVTTEDGYIITMGRIPGMINEFDKISSNSVSKPAIILQHGLGINMMQWIFNTNDKTHAFVLARSGYDVWMPNNRGTQFSLGHVSLDAKKDREYWYWSWEEMGTKDLVAAFDYILNLTKQSKLSYVGHSEGNT